jgi:hypothetical protein
MSKSSVAQKEAAVARSGWLGKVVILVDGRLAISLETMLNPTQIGFNLITCFSPVSTEFLPNTELLHWLTRRLFMV